MKIRPYRTTDYPAVLHILSDNVPRYFAPEEVSDLADYLRYEREDYFVVEEEERMVGSGGINYLPDWSTAVLSWGFLHPDFQRRGIGRRLAEHRIEHIKGQNEYIKIRVRTSQLTWLFYQKLGFTLLETQRDYWAKGYDLYHMEMKLP